MRDKVSIVIPCYNDANYVEQALKSAIEQDYSDREIIIVDDGSNEATKRILSLLEPKVDLLITQNNKGVGAARNAGILRARGKYILVLDSDDYFESSFCKKAVEVLQGNEEVKVVTCYARWFKNGNDFRIFKPPGGTLKNFLLKHCTLSNSLFYRSDWEMCGGYDEKMIKGFEDWEFFIRLHKNGGHTHVIPEVLFHYRKRKTSVSTVAKTHRFELLEYIYFKHADLYKEHYELLIGHLLSRILAEEKDKAKKERSLEFKIGKAILQPIRKLKSFFNP